ncbi:von Willebrand factor C and EGF domain-containing protein-like isoform X4 [Cuculus canorus]|uniref:von Willebrand factor C and EGF domain-containing protein-like isoform X4 n=1 Tax=Cuculus canorus TaxID=55661 RepID=UPI0023AA5261|nr:von Willebrand factor C and EGF domain-containing protein-like isoform X4 [Cuculus canorus]
MYDNSVEFPTEQIWSPGDPCRRLSCKRTDCVKTCPYPILIPGQCCPNCSAGCNYVGRIFYNNETFPSVLDPCLSCICLPILAGANARPSRVSPVSRSWARWPVRPWTVPSSAPTPSTPRASAALSVTTATTRGGRW